ncbi:MAG: nuclear transport factor 2 family protein [Acidobacteria bacterium]|nr:nuclear transport factor 2 family protein [Acidobacteriota bacterium]
MNKILLVVIFILLNVAGLSAQEKKISVPQPSKPKDCRSLTKNEVERTLENLECELTNALVSRDAGVLNRLLAEDFSISGMNITKKSYASLITDPRVGFTSVEKSQIRIKIYGETAVITGRNKTDRNIENGVSTNIFNFMDVWVKNESGDWQCAAMAVDSINFLFV